MPQAGQARNWGLLVMLEVNRFWILAAISCKLQASFFTSHQNAATCSEVHWFLAVEIASVGFWDSSFPALLKYGETHGQPKLNKTSLS